MLSLSFIREHPDAVREGARRKGETVPLEEILHFDQERRGVLAELEQLKFEQNRRSAALAKKPRDDTTIEEMRRLRGEIKALEQRLDPIDARLNDLLLLVPNPPHESVP